jgi:Pyruvate/2-oxoglutarate dehydrogenase complex, dihydrolipoamide dehydrogenase (E3) component, and related enzymes
LPTFERDISLNLAMCLKKLGAEIVTGAAVTEITDNGVRYSARGKEYETVADAVIVCTGRRANIEGLGLENTKIKFDKFGVYADEYRHTDDDVVYAVGDVVAKNVQLAHNATYEAELVVHNIIYGDVKRKPKFVPACVYTSPEVASVGLTEADCAEAGIETEIGKFPMGANGKAVLSGEDRGFIKVIFDKNNSKLLGVSLLSEHATDIIGAITTLVETEASRDEILNSVYPHPTICEAFYEAVLDSVGRAIHLMKRR